MEHRILLLGCGEAGKSTFIKQMRIIHSGGFTEKEKLEIKMCIANNILSAVQTLLENSTTDAWSEQMENDARVIEALNLKGVQPKVSETEIDREICERFHLDTNEAAGLRAKYEIDDGPPCTL